MRTVCILQGMFGLIWPGSFPFDRQADFEVIGRVGRLCGMRYQKFVAARGTFVLWPHRGSQLGSF